MNLINLKDYFGKVYVINLDRRTDRYDEFTKEVINLFVDNIERYSAIDGNTLTIDNKRLLPGEIGILLSHLDIIRKCKVESVDSVLILEDDVIFGDNIDVIEEYIKAIPSDWDFIYFGGNHVYGSTPITINDKIIKLNNTYALQCVGIHSRMFDIIEQTLSQMIKQVDVYYAEMHNNVNAYGFSKNIASQRPGYSDIQRRNVNYNHYFNI